MNSLTPSTHLLLVLATPLIGAVVAWVLGARGRHAVRQSAVVTAGLTLVSTGWLIVRYLQSPEAAAGEPYAVTTLPWLVSGIFDVRFSIGLDGLSLWLFGLSALLSLTAVLVSWEAIKERPIGFYVLLLVLEAAMLGVFVARDVILFYVFFEFTLVPLFFLIGIWGHDDRRRAAVKFFLYTLAGSVLAFLGLLVIVLWHASHVGNVTFDIDTLTAGMAAHPLPMNAEGGWLQLIVFWALFAGFAIKVPIVPFHTWLPLAHVEAPTGGSVDLAGVLLKIGIYGFLRFSLPMLPDASAVAAPWLFGLGVVGILYGALVALVQSDLKRLIAYSSVSHMGYCVLGIFALERVSLEGANLQLINHGLSSAGLFALVGMIYERFHTRSIVNLGGIATKAPWLTVLFMVFTFSSIGLPGLNGFVGEFMILAGSFQRAWTGVAPAFQSPFLVMSVSAVLGVVLGAWYMLWAVERVFFGTSRQPPHGPPVEACDLRWYETLSLLPLVVFVFWIGIAPAMFLHPAAAAVRNASSAAAEAFADRMQAAQATVQTIDPTVNRVVVHPHASTPINVSPQPLPSQSSANP
ncbi:MAG: NADH-quinone oxidoreductase subunit M [Planctomycetia bacterium]|nr:NADH-quinone oxidoreductase subunit M [Planctomycetia bacterium]